MLKTLCLIALGYPDPREAARKALNGDRIYYPSYKRFVNALVQSRDTNEVTIKTALVLIVLGWSNPEKIAQDALLGTVPFGDNALVQRLLDEF